ncbi:S1 RNA-binding domain-containing protein [Arcobacter sp. FWKO B]|uniref:CvfB family protein n=1 Tax=Arcobacter sp. FWKO B TaxID=2593672 RepID=UPI0018A517F7|nr:S1-like domain-containing RNA-binding protein [Arcobacter sp. FWKO B]QOG11303.1 DNA-binding protein [Arcobacter sp. FWKO B]
MNKNLEIGHINRLKIYRRTDNGYYLQALNEEEVLMPNQYIEYDMNEDDEIDVFVYTDSEDRLVAVTRYPKAIVGEFGYFEVVDVAPFGAFVDWGLPKDLFVPKSMQKIPFKVGMKTVLMVCIDEETGRIVGNHKYAKLLNKDIKELVKGQEINFIVYKQTELGYKVIVNNQFDGLLFSSDVFEHIEIGDIKKGYIKNIREDGKIDISLRPAGEANENLACDKIIEVLKSNDGTLNFTYKSTPEQIKDTFGLSRKIFKKALTSLSESGKINISESGISLK